MTAEEKFLFDLQGFLVVPGVLTCEEVASLNAAIDANYDRAVDDPNVNLAGSRTLRGSRRRMTMAGLLTLPVPSCQPFRSLLAHPRIVPYLNTLLGRGWRLDHEPQVFLAESGAEGLVLHGSVGLHMPAEYVCVNGQMRCGMISLEFHLTPNESGAGGFCAIPGSHKSNFPIPRDIVLYERHQDLVVNPACNPGDLLIFNEATIHGTLPWRADHERRALLYRYSPKWLHYAGGIAQTLLPDWVSELSEAQQAVLEPPYFPNRPIIDDDGTVIRPAADVS